MKPEPISMKLLAVVGITISLILILISIIIQYLPREISLGLLVGSILIWYVFAVIDILKERIK